SFTLLIRSSRLSSTPLNPSSSCRRRFCSASLATVFEVVFADSRTRRRAKRNSYHQILPRLNRAIYTAVLSVRDIDGVLPAAESSPKSIRLARWEVRCGPPTAVPSPPESAHPSRDTRTLLFIGLSRLSRLVPTITV